VDEKEKRRKERKKAMGSQDGQDILIHYNHKKCPCRLGSTGGEGKEKKKKKRGKKGEERGKNRVARTGRTA